METDQPIGVRPATAAARSVRHATSLSTPAPAISMLARLAINAPDLARLADDVIGDMPLVRNWRSEATARQRQCSDYVSIINDCVHELLQGSPMRCHKDEQQYFLRTFADMLAECCDTKGWKWDA